jgi:hypothetical protein
MAAILGGAMRAAASFLFDAGGEIQRQSLYFAIDLLILFGVLGVYAQNHQAVGRWGAGGFLTTVVGILLVRSSGAVPGLDLYPAGALLVAIGWVLLSFRWWKTNRGPVFVPVLFVVSIITGLIGQIAPRAAILSVVSGVIFGAALIGAGLQLLASSRSAPASQ